MDAQPHSPVTTNDIKVALLENNAVIFDRMDQAIEKSGKNITGSVEKQTSGFIVQLATVSKTQGVHEQKIINLEAKYDKLWSKIATLVAISNIIVGAVIYIVVGGHVGH